MKTAIVILNWNECLEALAEERDRGGVRSIDAKTISTITSHAAGYIDKDNELIVGLQTDELLKRAIEKAGEGERLLLDNVIGSSPLSSLDLKNKSVILAIGPERGWSERERKLFLSSSFSPVLIGDRILRTETAAVAAPSVALSRMGLL